MSTLQSEKSIGDKHIFCQFEKIHKKQGFKIDIKVKQGVRGWICQKTRHMEGVIAL
jgi:hypothetical protein